MSRPVLIFLFCFFSLNSSDLQAIKGLDVFYQENGDQKNIRIILYDITAQKLEAIHFITGSSIKWMKKQLRNSAQEIPFSIQTDGSVRFEEDFDPAEYMVRSSKDIHIDDLSDPTFEESFKLFDISRYEGPYDKRYSSLYRTRNIEHAKNIIRQLDNPRKIQAAGEFDVHLFNESEEYQETKVKLNNVDKDALGWIGETVTELTMLSFGYDQFVSKYEANHGLDGIFMDRSTTPECFITESKCGEVRQTAAKTMDHYLTEEVIFEKIHRGLTKSGTSIQNSSQFVHNFISEKTNSKSVFKFAHRTRWNGLSQGACAPIDYDVYMGLSGKPTVSSVLRQFRSLSVEDRKRFKRKMSAPHLS